MKSITNCQWDVTVVGAGPAGSVAARQLALAGHRVLLLDKATFPRRKVCGCCLNAAALSTLSDIGLGDLVTKLGAVPLTHARLASAGRSASVPMRGGVALSRDAFDVALIEAATDSGVTFRPHMSIRLEAEHPDAIVLKSPEGIISTRVLVAADGLNGTLKPMQTRATQIAANSRIGAGCVLPASNLDYPAGTIVMAVGKGGYVGMVRLEDGQLDIAAAFDPSFVRDTTSLGHSAVRILQEAGLPRIEGLAQAPWRGTPLLTRRPDTIVGERWLAVGDAAGYVEPFTGEGMAWAILGASAIVKPVQQLLNGQPCDWPERHARILHSRQRLCRTIARLLRSPWLTRWTVRVLNNVPQLSIPIIRRLNRPARFEKVSS